MPLAFRIEGEREPVVEADHQPARMAQGGGHAAGAGADDLASWLIIMVLLISSLRSSISNVGIWCLQILISLFIFFFIPSCIRTWILSLNVLWQCFT